MEYSLVSPAQFSPEHAELVESFKYSVRLVSDQARGVILGIKDIHSRHIISTDEYARIVSLPSGEAVADRMDYDMPCPGTVQFADCYIAEDQSLMACGDVFRSINVLNVHQYADGLHARVFTKSLLKHVPSRSLLGVIYSAHDVQIDDVLGVMPNYITEFAVSGCSIEKIVNNDKVGGVVLTDYEQEICFLLLLNWGFGQIAEFMNKFRPMVNGKYRVADSIIKGKNRICEKMNIPTTRVADLREALVAMGMHRKLPSRLFDRLIGSTIIR